jgi:hypothetical protein
MKPKKKSEIEAYRGHAIERMDYYEGEIEEIPEEHGTNTFYECGVAILQDKEEVPQ